MLEPSQKQLRCPRGTYSSQAILGNHLALPPTHMLLVGVGNSPPYRAPHYLTPPFTSPPLLSFRLLTADHPLFLSDESTPLILSGPLQLCSPGVPKSDGVQID